VSRQREQETAYLQEVIACCIKNQRENEYAYWWDKILSKFVNPEQYSIDVGVISSVLANKARLTAYSAGVTDPEQIEAIVFNTYIDFTQDLQLRTLKTQIKQPDFC